MSFLREESPLDVEDKTGKSVFVQAEAPPIPTPARGDEFKEQIEAGKNFRELFDRIDQEAEALEHLGGTQGAGVILREKLLALRHAYFDNSKDLDFAIDKARASLASLASEIKIDGTQLENKTQSGEVNKEYALDAAMDELERSAARGKSRITEDMLRMIRELFTIAKRDHQFELTKDSAIKALPVSAEVIKAKQTFWNSAKALVEHVSKEAKTTVTERGRLDLYQEREEVKNNIIKMQRPQRHEYDIKKSFDTASKLFQEDLRNLLNEYDRLSMKIIRVEEEQKEIMDSALEGVDFATPLAKEEEAADVGVYGRIMLIDDPHIRDIGLERIHEIGEDNAALYVKYEELAERFHLDGYSAELSKDFDQLVQEIRVKQLPVRQVNKSSLPTEPIPVFLAALNNQLLKLSLRMQKAERLGRKQAAA